MSNVYLIMPLEHGNGGWYGYEVLAELPLNELLLIDPVLTYLNGYYNPMFGSQLRICRVKNPNHPMFLWEHEEENRWYLAEPETI
jgi:hypothetical protein